jgi:hypothetical protein
VAVKRIILRHELPAEVGMRSNDTTKVDGKDTVPTRVPLARVNPPGSEKYCPGKLEGRFVGGAEGFAVLSGEGVGLKVSKALVGSAVGRGVGAAVISEMAKLRILAVAAASKTSEAYTCTDGHVVWGGVGNEALWVGIVTAPDTPEVNTLLTSSIVSVAVDQAFKGRAWPVMK